MKTRKNDVWVTVHEISKRTMLSQEKVKGWLKSGNCPFGYGFCNEDGNFLSFVLRHNFENWYNENFN